MHITPTRLLLLSLVVCSTASATFVSALHKYSEQLKNYLPKMIKDVSDVAGDGNCMPRSLAKLIYDNEDDWELVRELMATELRRDKVFYVNVFKERYNLAGWEGAYESALAEYNSALASTEKKDEWMEMPASAHVAANVFGRPVVFFNTARDDVPSATFRPYFVPPYEKPPIALANVGQGRFPNHYIPVYLQPDGLLPDNDASWTAWTSKDGNRPSHRPQQPNLETTSQQPEQPDSQKPSQQPEQPNVEKPSQQPTQPNLEKPSQQPKQQPSQQPEQPNVEKPSQQPTQPNLEKPSQQPKQPPSQEPEQPDRQKPSQQPEQPNIEMPSRLPKQTDLGKPSQDSQQPIDEPSSAVQLHGLRWFSIVVPLCGLQWFRLNIR